MSTIRVSEGTAGLLGLKSLRAADQPTTAYLMIGGDCMRSCAFCAQGRGASGAAGRLSRVTWPEYPWAEVLPALARACADGLLKRVCVQTVSAEGAVDALEAALVALREAGINVPLSASVYVRHPEQLLGLFSAGLDRAGLAIDVASPALYREIKGGSLAQARGLLTSAVEHFPGRVSTHLICGLGETDRELLGLAEQLLVQGVTVGLFAFTPVRGTPLEHRRPPDLARYRRVQAALELLRCGQLTVDGCGFDGDGNLARLHGWDEAMLRRSMGQGKAFMTSGCPGCNRPYYNERPGQTPYNYPRPLTAAELEMALEPVLVLLGGAEA